MKIRRKIMFLPLLLIGALFVLTACGGDGSSVSTGGGTGKHEHTWTKVEGKEATCQEEGLRTYYTCSGCKEFKDEAGNMYSSKDAFIIPVGNHKYVHVDGVGPCEEGLREHYTCQYCDKYFDLNYNEQNRDFFVQSGGHNIELFWGSEPGCESDGMEDHFRCTKCGTYYRDREGTQEVDPAELIIPACHKLEHHNGDPATCLNSGFKEYWRCTACLEYFSDENGTNKVTWDDLYVEALGHSITTWVEKSPATCELDREEIAYCDHEGCDYFEEKVIEDTKLGHNFEDGFCKNCECREFSQGLEYRKEFGWNGESDYYVITSIGTCTDEEIVLPETHLGLEVREVSAYDFNNAKSIYFPKTIKKINGLFTTDSDILLEEVTFEEGVEFVDGFEYAVNLTSVTLPSTVKKLGQDAFKGCTNLKTINLENVEEISSYAFEDCTSLEKVELDSLVKVGCYAFRDTEGIKELNLPSTLVNVEHSAFSMMRGLETVSFENGLETLSNNMFSNCDALEEVVLSSTLVKIDYSAFQNCLSLKEITIPASVKEVGSYAFKGCTALEKVVFESENSQLEKIYTYAFGSYESGDSYVMNIKELYFPVKGEITFEDGIFSRTKVDAIYFSDEDFEMTWATNIFTEAESNPLHCGDVKIFVPNGTEYKEIESLSFDGEGQVVIEQYAFYNVNYDVSSYEKVYWIMQSAFENASKLTVAHIKMAIGIEGNAFKGSSLKEVYVLEDDIVGNGGQIMNFAFANCRQLTKAVLTNNVIYIGGSVFAGCDALEELSVPFFGPNLQQLDDNGRIPTTSSEIYPIGWLFGDLDNEGMMKAAQLYYYNGYNNATTVTEYDMPENLHTVYLTRQTGLYYGAIDNTNIINLYVTKDFNFVGEHGLQTNARVSNLYYGGSLNDWISNTYVAWDDTYHSYSTRLLDNFYYYEDGEYVLLENLVIDDNSPETFKYASFCGVYSLKTVTIETTKTLYTNPVVFYDCASLYEVYDNVNRGYEVGSDGPAYLAANAKVVHKSSEEESIYKVIDGYKFAIYEENEEVKCELIEIVDIKEELILPEYVEYEEGQYEYTLKGYLFSKCQDVKKIVLPEFVNVYGGMFYNCNSLEYLSLPHLIEEDNLPNGHNTLAYLFGGYENEECLPETLTYIELTNGKIIPKSAFAGAAYLETVILGEGYEIVDSFAFEDCAALKELYVADTVTQFNSNFNGCESLEIVKLSKNITNYISTGATFFPACSETIKEVYIHGFYSTTSYSIESILFGYDGAPNLEKLVIYNGAVTSQMLSRSTFESLKEIYLPAYYLTYVGEDIYSRTYNAISLENEGVDIYVNGTIDEFIQMTYDRDVVSKNNIYVLDENGEYISLDDIKEVFVPNTVLVINDYALAYMDSLEKVVFEEGSDSVVLGNYALSQNPNLKEVVISSNVGELGYGLLQGSPVEKLTLPSLGEDIYDLFRDQVNCSVKELTYNGGTNLSESDLFYLPNLEKLTVADTIVTISTSSHGHYGAYKNIEIYFNVDLETYLTGELGEITMNSKNIYVLDEEENYVPLSEDPIFVLPENIEIGYYALAYTHDIQVVYVPASTTFDAYIAKETCLVFESAATPNINSTGGGSAHVLENVKLDNVVCDDTFIYLLDETLACATIISLVDPTITEAVIPASVEVGATLWPVTKIGKQAFKYNENLKSLEVTSYINEIGDEAFAYANIDVLEIPNPDVKLGTDEVFYYFSGIVILNKTSLSYGGSYYYIDSLTHSYYQDSYFVLYLTGENCYVMHEDVENKVLYALDATTNTAVLVHYSGEETEFVVPESITVETVEYIVNKIGPKAFMDSKVEKVTLTNIEVVGAAAFQNVGSLTEVIFDEDVDSLGIDDYAFFGTSITEVTIGSNVAYIGSYAFANNGELRTVTFETNTDRVISSGAPFANCTMLDSLYFDKSVGQANYMSKGSYAVVYSEAEGTNGKPYNSNVGYVYFNIDTTTEGSINLLRNYNNTGIDYYLDLTNKTATISNVDNSLTSVTIPEYVEANGEQYAVTVIGVSSFALSSITSLNVPDTIKTISAYAFYSCEALEKVYIGDVETIETYSFVGTYNVREWNVPFLGVTAEDEKPIFGHIFGDTIEWNYSGSGFAKNVKVDLFVVRNWNAIRSEALYKINAVEVHFYASTDIDIYGSLYSNMKVERLYFHGVGAVPNRSYLNDSYCDNHVEIIFAEADVEDNYYRLYDNYTADKYPTIDGITYELNEDNTCTVIYIDSSLGEDAEVPATITYKDVTYTVTVEEN